MKVVILGAGASFDSLRENYSSSTRRDDTWRPPLAKELFDTRESFKNVIKRYPAAHSLSTEANVSDDIEEYLEKINETATKTDNENLLRQIQQTHFYLQELLYKVSINHFAVGDSNYSALINSAYRYAARSNEQVCFITFNYDILFELAMQNALHHKCDVIDDYISNRHIKFIKLHGSCNWHKYITDIRTSNGKYESTDDIVEILRNHPRKPKLFDGISIMDWVSRNQKTGDSYHPEINFYYPWLAIPLKEKTEFLAPPNHVQVAKDFLKSTNDILIIGWKGAEKTFRDLLVESVTGRDVKIIVVNSVENGVVDEPIKSNLNLSPSMFEHICYKGDQGFNTGGFSNFISQKGHESFFS